MCWQVTVRLIHRIFIFCMENKLIFLGAHCTVYLNRFCKDVAMVLKLKCDNVYE